MTEQELNQLKLRIASLEAENASLKSVAKSKLSFKVSEKGAVSVYGLGRFPVTLYRKQMTTLLDSADNIRAFMEQNSTLLQEKV